MNDSFLQSNFIKNIENQPIFIRVGYEWDKGEEKNCFWDFVRELIKTCVNSINKQQKNKRLPGISVYSSRMRAMHGGDLLGAFLERSKRADILIFNITGNNPNVLLELGIALGIKGLNGNVFIMQEVEESNKPISPTPSDLNGYFFTRYKKDKKKGLKLIETQAFLAALKSRIKDAARRKGLWQDTPGLDDEDAELNTTNKEL